MIEFLWTVIAIILVITTSILLVGLGVVVATALEILENRKDVCVMLSFYQFKKFYELSPEDYKLCEYHVDRYESRGSKKYRIEFSLIDTFRYIRFCKDLAKASRANCCDKLKLDYIKSVQRDIDKLNKQAEKTINKAKEELRL